ncbi:MULTISPECIES: hypothetical protein [unclassified Streptomyces]|uniref:hypothetical protein n=1 Tax=unclassified Streptomyces TaxID=2593676 RepID=UPI001F0402D4|nr:MULTISPECIES: hypothetical protein [unclassified Streptomyces]MCH0562982.1 hypothetical protein [Streptomyces sp. MUM 2J]MCH0571942.1 hypothetical protein [Streptomyces sp. MUM 136J]
MSALTQAVIINAAVLIAVLEADLGPHREIGRMRILRPLLTTAGIVPAFVRSPATHGSGLVLEIALAVVGLAVGLLAMNFTTVYRSPRTGKPVSRAGSAYAALWIGVVGARTAFSYGSVHWFGPQLGRWTADHRVTGEALADALLMMAVAMTLIRTIGLAARAAAVGRQARTPVAQ